MQQFIVALKFAYMYILFYLHEAMLIQFYFSIILQTCKILKGLYRVRLEFIISDGMLELREDKMKNPKVYPKPVYFGIAHLL